MPTVDDDLEADLQRIYLHPVEDPDVNPIIRRGRRRQWRRRGALGTAVAAVVATGVIAGPLNDRPELRTAGDGAPVTTPGPARSDPTQLGEAVGRLEVPAIGVDSVFVEGMTAEHLKLGPGRYPDTPPPGQFGNSAIAGHRTTYGAPFNRLDELEPGDEIVIWTAERVFTYEVRETLVVDPGAVEVLGPSFWSDRWGQGPTSTLTLTTENPKFSSTERLVVGAELIGEPVGSASPSVGPSGTGLAPG